METTLMDAMRTDQGGIMDELAEKIGKQLTAIYNAIVRYDEAEGMLCQAQEDVERAHPAETGAHVDLRYAARYATAIAAQRMALKAAQKIKGEALAEVQGVAADLCLPPEVFIPFGRAVVYLERSGRLEFAHVVDGALRDYVAYSPECNALIFRSSMIYDRD